MELRQLWLFVQIEGFALSCNMQGTYVYQQKQKTLYVGPTQNFDSSSSRAVYVLYQMCHERT